MNGIREISIKVTKNTVLQSKKWKKSLVSEELKVLPDVKHSQKEEKFIALGKTQSKKNIFAVFILRKKRVRIISARKMHRKEVRKYEKT